MTEKNEICKALRKMSKTFNKSQRPDDETLEIYSDILVEFTPGQITTALKKIILKGSAFYPSCGEIVVEITGKQNEITEDQKADVVAGEIVGALKRFGSYRAIEAKDFLGVVAWRAVEYLGGWQSLCVSDVSDLGMLRAQAKRAARSATITEQNPAILKTLGIQTPISIGTLLVNDK